MARANRSVPARLPASDTTERRNSAAPSAGAFTCATEPYAALIEARLPGLRCKSVDVDHSYVNLKLAGSAEEFERHGIVRAADLDALPLAKWRKVHPVEGWASDVDARAIRRERSDLRVHLYSHQEMRSYAVMRARLGLPAPAPRPHAALKAPLSELARRLRARYPVATLTHCHLQGSVQLTAWRGSREALEAIAPIEAFSRRGSFVDEFGTCWSAGELEGAWCVYRYVDTGGDAPPRDRWGPVRRFPTKRVVAEVERLIRRAQRAAGAR